MLANQQWDETRRLVWLARLVALSAFLLIASTWPLWTPQHVFPQVPVFGWLRHAPDWAAWCFLAVMLAVLLVLLLTGQCRAGRIACLIFALAVIALVCLDQHRLQPWAYQFALIAVVLTTARPSASPPLDWGTGGGRADGPSALRLPDDASAVNSSFGIRQTTNPPPLPPLRKGGSDDSALFWLRVLIVGLYVHSAVSKLDHSFFTTHGQQLLGAVLQAMDLKLNAIPATLRPWFAASIPLGELLTAVLLCVPRWRMVGLIGAVTMHVLLLIALGPWGLGHQPGVLIWNGYFIVQDVILFAGRSARLVGLRLNGLSWIAATVLVAATVLPLLEPFGWFDHWPAWALYASRPARVSVFISRSEQHQLAASAQRYLVDVNPLDDWLQLRLDRWSLDALHAPIYPQDRFRIGVALAVAQQSGLADIRVILESPANRWTGKRGVREIRGIDALSEFADTFWLNAHPSELLNR